MIALDLQMPGAAGWDALRALKEDPRVREIPVIVQSGAEGQPGGASLLGLVDLLSKPLEREELLRAVTRNLDRDRERTVLVVEDDPDAQTIIRDHLRAAGLSVVVTDGAEAAEVALAEGIPDAILLDLLLPGMDGMSFLARLREDPRHVGIPVIICTAKDLTREERGFLQAKTSAIVSKGRGFEEDLEEVFGRIFTLRDRG